MRDSNLPIKMYQLNQFKFWYCDNHVRICSRQVSRGDQADSTLVSEFATYFFQSLSQVRLKGFRSSEPTNEDYFLPIFLASRVSKVGIALTFTS